MNGRDVIKLLLADGWVHVRTAGSHWQFRHPERPNVITVPHPKRDLPLGTVKAIERQSGTKVTT